MPGVFIFTRSKDDPTTLFVGPYWSHVDGGNMVNIEIADVQGLSLALSGKAPTTHDHTWAQITGESPWANKTHTHTIDDVDQLSPTLNSKVGSADIKNIVRMTQAQYDAITPAADTLYIIKEA